MSRYKLPCDPLQYDPADADVLKRLFDAGYAGDEDAAYACVAGMALPALNAYGYIASIIPLVVRRQFQADPRKGTR